MKSSPERLEQAREEQRRAVEAGKCRQCRQHNPDAGKRLLCPTCRATENAKLRAKRAARTANGTCQKCGRKPGKGHSLCKLHRQQAYTYVLAYRERLKMVAAMRRDKRRKRKQGYN
jgi:hypothetical protein